VTTTNDELDDLLRSVPSPWRPRVRRALETFATHRHLDATVSAATTPLKTRITQLQLSIDELRARLATIETKLAKLTTL